MKIKGTSIWTWAGFILIMGTPLWVALTIGGCLWYAAEHPGPPRATHDCTDHGGYSVCVKR